MNRVQQDTITSEIDVIVNAQPDLTVLPPRAPYELASPTRFMKLARAVTSVEGLTTSVCASHNQCRHNAATVQPRKAVRNVARLRGLATLHAFDTCCAIIGRQSTEDRCREGFSTSSSQAQETAHSSGTQLTVAKPERACRNTRLRREGKHTHTAATQGTCE